MVEKLIGCLSAQIKKRWEEYEVYTEGVYQHAVKPCFFVECENVEQIKLLGERFYLRVTVKITLQSDSEIKKYESQKMIGDFFALMNHIEVDDVILYGRKIHSKWENGALTLRGSYNVFTRAESDKNLALMETIEAEQEI